MFEKGQGVLPSDQKAIEYYRLAAAQGYELAQLALIEMEEKLAMP